MADATATADAAARPRSHLVYVLTENPVSIVAIPAISPFYPTHCN